MKEEISPNLESLLELKQRQDPTAFLGSREMYLIFGAICLIGLVCVLWAVYFRKPRRNKRSKYLANDMPGIISRAPRDRHRKRKRRWANRNPTLSQTGGLPPPRDPSALSDPE